LSAAAVIGSRFRLDLLTALGVEPVVDELVATQFIDQVTFTRQPEYVFHHALVRAVAYEAQLKSDRAELHRRVAAAIEHREADSVDENAALIAEHLESAGDLRAACDWHMHAGSWAVNRDVAAAWLSWERARGIADALPTKDQDRATMRVASRTALCRIAWRVHADVAGNRFEELRDMCTAAGDTVSLAIATAALVIDNVYKSRLREASQLASEVMALIESIDDPTLTVGLSCVAIRAKFSNAEFSVALRWSERVIDLADGDPLKGNFMFGSPLALAYATRGITRYHLGHPGWRDDLRQGLSFARVADPMTYATLVGYVYFAGISTGALRPDDGAVSQIEEALGIAERSGDDFALAVARMTLGFALIHRATAQEQARGQLLVADVRDAFVGQRFFVDMLPLLELYLARERARRKNLDDVIPQMRAAVDHLFPDGRLLVWSLPATAALVETILDRSPDGDLGEAERAVSRLATAHTDDGVVIRDVTLLHLRALLARAHADDVAYRGYRDRYREMATALGFEGHIQWAEAMP
jgi:hypothetical protein